MGTNSPEPTSRLPHGHFPSLHFPLPSSSLCSSASLSPEGRAGRWWEPVGPPSFVSGTWAALSQWALYVPQGHLHPSSTPAGNQQSRSPVIALPAVSWLPGQVTSLCFHLKTCKHSLWIVNKTQRFINMRFSHYTIMVLRAFG